MKKYRLWDMSWMEAEEAFNYTDMCRSLYGNGTRKIIFLNGHGGNREPLIRAGRNVRDLGMLTAIVEWWTIGTRLMPDLFSEPKGVYMSELAVAIAVHGMDIADLRGGGYKKLLSASPNTCQDSPENFRR